MPADADVYLGHPSYVALAQGPSGLYAFAHGTSAFQAMQAALKAAGDPDVHVTKLINTNSRELDPQQQWQQGLRYDQMRRVAGKGIKWYLMACLVVLFIIIVAAIGVHTPVLAFILIGLAIAFVVWRYGRRR